MGGRWQGGKAERVRKEVTGEKAQLLCLKMLDYII